MLPDEHIESLLKIEEWFLDTYAHDKLEGIQFKRIIDELYGKEYDLVFTSKNIKLLKDSVRWADTLNSDCPVGSKVIQEIGKLLEEAK